jgi:hypothetical protein
LIVGEKCSFIRAVLYCDIGRQGKRSKATRKKRKKIGNQEYFETEREKQL